MSEVVSTQPDAIIIGAGLAGLVAAAELIAAGKHILVLEQEPEASLGGQAWWSFGGIFLIDSPEQRRLGVKDSLELARQDWLGTAGFDREEDAWPKKWAEAYLQFAAGEKRAWLRERGVKFFPIVGWAERGGYGATGPGNSVPRFHITWGTGPGIVAPFEKILRDGIAAGLVDIRFRHRVDELITSKGAVVGARGAVLAPDSAARGEASNREVVEKFDLRAPAVIVTSGGIGGNHELVRKAWPKRMGPAPKDMLSGVPAHVDGRMLAITEKAGARLINGDRMWHYVEGITNYAPVWAKHGIRILPGPSSIWLDATGKRLPAPLLPGFDTLDELLAGMQAHSPEVALDVENVRYEVESRDREMANGFTKDAQITALRLARKYLGDKLIRVAKPHRILDPSAGPLIAVKLHVLTRKSLGGIETDLSSQALDGSGNPIPGLYAAGEASGFGGGGVHGYRALEGTFLGGCLFSGRAAGRAVAGL